ncbi:GntR family transcriptional regulator [Actinophytocola sediminis]
MLFRVDPANGVPLSAQIAACVRRGIAEETVRAGDRLPPARELATSLGVSIHTVLAGYQQLRAEGLIELRRSRGATVAAGVRPDRAVLVDLVRQVVEAANRMNLDEQELLDLLRSVRTSA